MLHLVNQVLPQPCRNAPTNLSANCQGWLRPFQLVSNTLPTLGNGVVVAEVLEAVRHRLDEAEQALIEAMKSTEHPVTPEDCKGDRASALVVFCGSAPAVAVTPAATEAPAPPNGVVVLYDSDSKVHDPNVNDIVDPDESKRVLDLLFRSRYLADRKQCPNVATSLAAHSLAANRQSGNFAPKVWQVARGSFTRAHASETLYVVVVGECRATHADNWGSDMLVVMDGDTVLTRILTTGSTSIGGLSDLDGDGRQEALLVFTWAGQGTSWESARLARIDGSTLKTLKDFGHLSGSNCFGISADKAETVAVVRATHGADGQVAYAVEKRTRPCP